VYRDQPAIQEAVRRALAGEEFISVFEFGPVSLELRSAPSRDENGAVIGFVSVATNVTDRFRLERQILEISDREQAHIGQDIHDGLCQQLVGIAFDANALEKMLVECSRAEAIAARRISMELDEAISESRRVSRGLCPVRLETEGLEPALKDLANSISERFRIRCFCKATSPEFECDSTTATHLYRIAQEAVNNAVKHSGARCVSIHLADHDGEIEMIVRDDGKGFEPGSTRTGGMGLYIMDYRARSIGGTVRVRRGSENGTVVTCRLQRKSP
jgi:two-component system CheB/CheR fusion protein